MSRLHDRVEAGIWTAMRLTGQLATLRRVAAAQGAYDPATGMASQGTVQEIKVPAIILTDSIAAKDGAVARRRTALIPAHVTARRYQPLGWGAPPWVGDIPLVPQDGDELVDANGLVAEVEGVPEATVVLDRVLAWRLDLGAGA